MTHFDLKWREQFAPITACHIGVSANHCAESWDHWWVEMATCIVRLPHSSAECRSVQTCHPSVPSGTTIGRVGLVVAPRKFVVDIMVSHRSLCEHFEFGIFCIVRLQRNGELLMWWLDMFRQHV